MYRDRHPANYGAGSFDEWDGGVRVPAVFYWKRAESNYKNLSSQVTGFVEYRSDIERVSRR